MDRIAVLLSNDPIKIIAHVSGNQIDILHCPFCGSGAVIGRSDGTVECSFCTSVFTVQSQPSYNGFPQSVDGQPYQWPGMPESPGVGPDPNAAMDPNDPNADPNAMDPNDPANAAAMSADPNAMNPTDGGIGNLPPGAPAGTQSGPGGDDDGDDSGDDDKPDFLKGKGDSKSDSKKSDSKDKKKSPPPSKKKSYKTASGAELDEDNYLAHLAISFAKDKSKAAAMVKAARRAF